VWSLCLKLSLLNPLHDFHSTCTNRPLFLVVQVDIILNSCLWVRPSPIPKLQHTLLPPKCYKLRSMPQLSSFSVVYSETHLWVPWRVWGCIDEIVLRFLGWSNIIFVYKEGLLSSPSKTNQSLQLCPQNQFFFPLSESPYLNMINIIKWTMQQPSLLSFKLHGPFHHWP
jgi:hypothetical protein